MNHKRKKKKLSDIIIDGFVYGVILLLAVVCFYPLVYSISMSFSEDSALISNAVWLFPKGFTLKSYKLVLSNDLITGSILNSIYYVVCGTLVKVTCTMTYGYILSKKEFVFKKFLDVFTLIPMFFGGGLIPCFLLIKGIGLYGSYWGIILAAAVAIWDALIAKTFFRSTISEELLDAAKIDGANQFQTYFRIVIPLSKTIIAILTLWASLGFWNDYLTPTIYINDRSKLPMQAILAEILAASAKQSTMAGLMSGVLNPLEGAVESMRMKYVLIVISTMPIMIAYPMIQKFFKKGVMIGSIKG